MIYAGAREAWMVNFSRSHARTVVRFLPQPRSTALATPPPAAPRLPPRSARHRSLLALLPPTQGASGVEIPFRQVQYIFIHAKSLFNNEAASRKLSLAGLLH